MAAGHVNPTKEFKIVFRHDTDEKNNTSNFQYVAVDKDEDVSLAEGKCEVLFIDGQEKEVEKRNLSEVTPGSIIAAIFSGSNVATMEDFKKESVNFFKKFGVNVVII
jgi:hypothetical protein